MAEPEIKWEAWALAMCSLLDAIEMSADDPSRVRELVGGRHKLAESFGLKVTFTGPAGGRQ